MISDINFHIFFFFLHFKVGFKIKLLLWVFNLEEGKATHSGILAWRIPWTEETGGLQSTGSQRVRYDCSDLACILTLGEVILPVCEYI